jgi:hypothetical protein
MRIFYLFTVVLFCLTGQFYSQTKYALIVAISDYPSNEKGETVWKDLSSENDVLLIKTMLKEQGFSEKNCSFLIGKEAIPINLDKEFEKLIEKLREGDIVYFHYSGHGQQVADITPKNRKDIIGGDEKDGYDEAFALYNAPLKFYNKGEYEMEHHYVDDQLKVQCDKIRKKIGNNGQVLVIIDSCHSGTITRGADDPNVRGTDVICAPQNWKANLDKDTSDSFGTDFDYNVGQPFGKMVAFFGCKADQLNNEFRPEGSEIRYGSLTYFLIQGMKKLGQNASYANLFSEVRKNMLIHFGGKQIPEIEGDDLNQAIFSNTFIPTKPFFNVESIYYDEVNLDAGSLSDLSLGDEIGLYNTDVNNPDGSKPLFEGKVVDLSALKSTIKLSHGIEGDSANVGLFRAFITKKQFMGSEIKVKLELKKHHKALESRFKQLENIKLVKSDFNYLVKEVEENKVIIYIGMDENLSLKSMMPMTIQNDNSYDSLISFLSDASKIEMLRKLSCNDPNIDFDVSFLNSLGKEVIEDVQYEIEVTNKGKYDFYMQVMEIEPNSKVSLLTGNQFNFTLDPGKKKKISLSFSANPAGMDQLLFIATSKPIDLSPLTECGKTIKTRGVSEWQPIDFFNNSSIRTRGAISNQTDATIKSLIFEIIYTK